MEVGLLRAGVKAILQVFRQFCLPAPVVATARRPSATPVIPRSPFDPHRNDQNRNNPSSDTDTWPL